MPIGHSSPCIWGNSIFLTGFDKERNTLIVLALDRKDGSELWRRTVTPKSLEPMHAVSNPATATVATDGEKIYAYFGSYGLLAYTMDGRPVWSAEMPAAQATFGNPVSPTIAGDLVLIARDYNPEPQLLAYDKATGKLAWRFLLEKKTGPAANIGHSTVVLFKDHAVLHRPQEVAGHSLVDGKRLWRVGLATSGTATPTVHANTIYVAGYTNFGEPGMNSTLPEFASMIEKADANKDGKISKADPFLSKPPSARSCWASHVNTQHRLTAASPARSRAWNTLPVSSARSKILPTSSDYWAYLARKVQTLQAEYRIPRSTSTIEPETK